MKFTSLAFLFAVLLFVGCDSGGTSNIVDDADAQKLAEYEKALADADALSQDYEGEK